MTPVTLTEARAIRAEVAREERIEAALTLIFSEADTVGPEARHKLSGILKHYAKDPHPFRACVKDNMKRFGPGRTEAVCATLKDIIRGTTHWRGHPAEDHGSPGAIAASDDGDEPMPVLTASERTEILLSLTDEDFQKLEEAIN